MDIDLKTETPETDNQSPDKPQGKAKNPLTPLRRALKITGNVLFALLLLAGAAMAFFMIRSRMSGTPPMVAGRYLFIVLSGSMEPSFDTGSVVLVKPTAPEEVKVGDVVTFSGFAGTKQLTTHRVAEIQNDEDYGLLFITKGDANEHNDPDPVLAKNIVGTVTGHIPLIGYLLHFIQTRHGLLLFILVPASLLIGFEVSGFLTKQSAKRNAKAKARKPKKPETVRIGGDHGKADE